MQYVPSPKVYEVCFYKKTINSIIIIISVSLPFSEIGVHQLSVLLL